MGHARCVALVLHFARGEWGAKKWAAIGELKGHSPAPHRHRRAWPRAGRSRRGQLPRLVDRRPAPRRPFWLMGTVVVIFLCPRDERWLVLTLFGYLTAIWSSSGLASFRHGGGDSRASPATSARMDEIV